MHADVLFFFEKSGTHNYHAFRFQYNVRITTIMRPTPGRELASRTHTHALATIKRKVSNYIIEDMSFTHAHIERRSN
jgi:hypothetical protein